MDRNSVNGMPQSLNTSICFSGFGSISSAKAESVNMSFRLDDGELHFVGDKHLFAFVLEADAKPAERARPANLQNLAAPIHRVIDQHAWAKPIDRFDSVQLFVMRHHATRHHPRRLATDRMAHI